MRLLIPKNLFIALIAGGGLAGALFYLGILDWQDTKTELRLGASRVESNLRSQINLNLEGKPITKSSVNSAHKCLTNLRQIEAAKRRLAKESNYAYGAIGWEQLKPYMKEIPKCPGDGVYSIGSFESLPQCSVAGAGTLDSEDDHILRNY